MANLPSVMRAWQYTSASPTLEANLTLRNDVPLPTFSASDPDPKVLIRVISASLNPVDYKVPEIPLLGRFIIPRPAIPGSDFCGRVVSLSSPEITTFHIGDIVFGRLDAPRYGSLGEYIAAPISACALVPPGVSPDASAAVPTTGLAEYKVLKGAIVKPGEKVFINGGAGGTGTIGIQIAKAMGCHVTTSCSNAKKELCTRMGADEVIDYTTEDVCQVLGKNGQVFSLVVDNVGGTGGLYRAAGRFLLKGGKFVQIGMPSGLRSMMAIMGRMVLSRFLGGGSPKFQMFAIKGAGEDLVKLGEWMAEGKVEPHIETVYEFESVPEAFAKLRDGHCEGKLVIHVEKSD